MADTAETAATNQRITIEPAGHRLRATLNGETLAESDDALILRESGYPQRTYFPQADVRTAFLDKTELTTHCPYKGHAAYWTVTTKGQALENGAWAYPDPLESVAEIAGHMSFVDAVTVEEAE